DIAPLLPSGEFEMPLMITDRAFNTDGSIHFTTVGDNPDVHPYWDPEYFGDQIMVNGKVWPNMNVKRQQYRFRIVDGSNARFYNLSFSNGMSFTQIAGDGSYLPKPVTLTEVMVAVCERVDILVDFSKFKPGTKIVLRNSAAAPFPGGDAPDANTSVVMPFTGVDSPAVASATPARHADHRSHAHRDPEHRESQALHAERAGTSRYGRSSWRVHRRTAFRRTCHRAPQGRHHGGVVHPEPDGGRPPDSHSPGRISAGGQAGHRKGPLQGLLGEPERHGPSAQSPADQGQCGVGGGHRRRDRSS